MRVCIILGTRPEIIKMSPIIRECIDRSIEYSILHTGQHYSYDMDKIFFDELGLPTSDYNLDVGSGSHAEQTGKIMIGVERILEEEGPNIVLVEGDTNTVLAAALAASKMGVNIGHVEAGLRSNDMSMPEEVNRILTDHVSEYLFAPTDEAKSNLAKEGIEEGVFVTGNTIVDSVHQNLKISLGRKDPLSEFSIEEKNYILVTAHRQENVDVEDRLKGIMEGLRRVIDEFRLPAIFPAHPRTQKMIESFGIETDGVNIIPPLGYLDFLQMESGAKLVLTDSGGVQEEACILGVPCVTLRDNTERPETIKVGSNILAGTDPESISDCAMDMMARTNDWSNPFGDGEAGKRIVQTIEEDYRHACS